MRDLHESATPTFYHFTQKRLEPLLVLFYELVALLCFVAVPILAVNWLRLPFIGSFIEHTRILNDTPPSQPGTWEIERLGLPFGVQLVGVDDVPVANVHQVWEVLKKYQPGEPVTLRLRFPGGNVQQAAIRLQVFPALDRLNFIVIPYFTGLVYLLSSLWVFSLRWRDSVGRVFALFTAAAGLTTAGLFDIYTTNELTIVWSISLALAGGALFNLAMVYPEEFGWAVHHPYLRWIGYIPAVLLAGSVIPTIYNERQPLDYVLVWRLEYLYFSLMMVLFLGIITYRRFRAPSPVVREQARFTLWGFAFSFTPLFVWFIIIYLRPSVTFAPALLLPMMIFPVLTGYAILRYRLLNTDFLLSRAVLYGLLTLLVASAYTLLVTGFSQFFGVALGPVNPFLVGLMVFFLALALNPLRSAFQQAIDAVFFRGQSAYRSRLQAFGHALTQAMDLESILGLLRKAVNQTLIPVQLHIFVYEPLSDQYVASFDEHGETTSDVRFAPNSPLVQLLAKQREGLFLSSMDTMPDDLLVEQGRLALLKCQLFVSLPGRQGLIGWLALGARRSGEPYTRQDFSYLESLSDQAALAVERAQVVGDLERRMREMNVLTRVAQGVNFSISFDDILELVYAQTTQVIPTRDFFVSLYNQEGDFIYHVFYLFNDERQVDKENRPLPVGQGLEQEVVHSQRAVVTDDYERECRSHGLLPSIRGLSAWLGVPLNAGAQTIGVVSLGSRDAAVTYTNEQCNLLQAIADQASGGIVKARLLNEAEQRARQLATLNEIGRGLTSTLEPKVLLQKILGSAVEILNCKAGTLFLVDGQTGELVFEVVVGPVAEDLLGKRLPPGTGLAGQAAEFKRAMIANDIKRRKDWFDQTDQETGFDTQDMLVIPMQTHGSVIGVIEVINKADGLPFNQNDLELLTTLTSQATVAIDNARLYTMTDQALAARVEELSIMQRIDQDLNNSLDVERAMRITLDWAMRRSEVDAGLVGIIEEDSIQVMAVQGYTTELLPYQMSVNSDGEEKKGLRLPLELGIFQNPLITGQPQYLYLSDSTMVRKTGGLSASGGFLFRSRSNLVIPIRRESQVIGFLMLEGRKDEPISDDMLVFLTRLGDHAAIAITNARLYAEVQAANLAKSKFVSFVAHELKNPMSSIKGYTELVMGGMAGSINDMQRNFLTTVRSNVDRMNTIVSDLNDLTKIQVGSLRLEYKTLAVSEVLEEVIRSIRHQIEEKEQKLIVQVPNDLPMVWADQLRLGQILTNLISNAHKYTHAQGEITVGAERTLTPSIDQAIELEVVHVWVQDSGIGIAPEDQANIFKQYFRTDASKEIAPGTGLGLNIVKSLVEMQGGRIWFESALGKGSTFHITVPVAENA